MALLAGAALAAAWPAAAQDASAAVQTRPISYLDAAKLLIATGKLDQAKVVLDALRKASPKDPEVIFLQGMLAEARGDYDGAIADFRAILIDQPDAARVRLELARVFFIKGDDANASRQFQFASALKLPAAARVNIETYQAAIRARRSWAFSLSLAVAPDSNLNSATAARRIDIYGLPFDLAADARNRSGAGFVADVAGEWAPRLGRHLRLRMGAVVDSLDYADSVFDDTTAQAYVGPQFVFARWDVSVLGTETARWFGNRPYYAGAGARLETNWTPTPRLRLSLATQRQNLVYNPNPGQTGAVTTASVDATYALTPASLLHAGLSATRQDARDRSFANTAASLSMGYSRELPLGFSASIEPSYSKVRYDAPLAAFGRARSDDVAELSVGLLNRAFQFKGFSPQIVYRYIVDRSDIPLYGFTRNRVELRVTRQF